MRRFVSCLAVLVVLSLSAFEASAGCCGGLLQPPKLDKMTKAPLCKKEKKVGAAYLGPECCPPAACNSCRPDARQGCVKCQK